MGEKKIIAGEYLYREGDVADAVYIVKSGKIELLDTEGSVEVQVDVIEPGKTLGELAVFDLKALRPRSARALEDSVLTSMSSEEFQALYAQCPQAIKPLLDIALEKMKATKVRVKIARRDMMLVEDITKVTIAPSGEKLKSAFKPIDIPVASLPFRIGGYPLGGQSSRRDQVHLSIASEDNPLRISRQHCEIGIENKAVIVTDLGSRFCTKVNGMTIGRGRGTYTAPLKKAANEIILGPVDSNYRLTLTCA